MSGVVGYIGKLDLVTVLVATYPEQAGKPGSIQPDCQTEPPGATAHFRTVDRDVVRDHGGDLTLNPLPR